MPRLVASTEAPVFLHCRDARCPGYQQEQVKGTREEHGFTYQELNNDPVATDIFATMIERSQVVFTPNDLDVLPCPECGVEREATGDPRPQYLPLSGKDPMGLVGGPKFNPSVVNTEADARVAELEAKLDKLLSSLEPSEDAA